MRTYDLRHDPGLDVPRPATGDAPLREVREIVEQVRAEGDRALLDLTERFDGVRLTPGGLRVVASEIDDAYAAAPRALIEALEEAAARLKEFSRRQLIPSWSEGIGGGELGEMVHAVERAGLYAPGGRTAYPSVVVMCAVPAGVAGVGRRVMCIPPSGQGSVAMPMLAAARVTGIDEIYRVGGAQAIAAMAFGTETVPKVDVIAGGGGLWVALAKREVAGFVAIDSVAGPSEIAVVADHTADPHLVASDLIAQAEHGPHGSFLVVTWDEDLLSAVERSIEKRLVEITASRDLRLALEAGAGGALVADLDQALEVIARFAPEHVELIFDGAEEAAKQVRNAGAVFVGPYSPVSLGDYLAGSNHTLPTMGSARWASGLRASLFQRTSAVVRHDRDSLAASVDHVRAFAEAEGLPNHARAVEARLSIHDPD